MQRGLFILLMVLFCSGCKTKYREPQGEMFNSFPLTKSVQFTEYMQLDTTVSHNKLILSDTSLFVINLGKLMKNYLFYEYSLSSKRQVGKFISWGTGKYNIYGSLSLGLYKNDKLWVHDLSLEKVLVASLKSRVSFDSLTDIKEFSTPGFMYSVQLMDSNRLLQSGIYSAPEYLQILDLSSGKPLKQISKFIPPDSMYHYNTWKAAYESFLFIHPDEKRAALACRYSDRIVAFDLTTGLNRMMNGPQNFEPEFETNATEKTKHYGITRTSKTRFAFIGGASTKNYLYFLFSGRKDGEDNYFKSDTIFVYDWNGNPVKEIKINKFVETIAVTEDDSRLYSVDEQTGKLLVASIN